jgi:hypothetical protein
MQVGFRMSAGSRDQLDILVAYYEESDGRVISRLIDAEFRKIEHSVDIEELRRKIAEAKAKKPKGWRFALGKNE